MFLRTLLSLCLLASAASAELLTPEAVTRLALAQNPELKAARELVAEAEARAAGIGRLPNPELESELALGTRDRGRLEVGLSQTFPRTSRLRLERRVAEESIALARLEITAAEATTIAKARTALVELAAAEAAVALAERQAALVREFANAQARVVQTGQLSSLDSDQAAFLAREAELSLAMPRAERTSAAFALAALLGLDGAPSLTAALDLSLPAEPPIPATRATPADLARAEGAVTVGDAEIALAHAKGREDYRLGVFAETEHERNDVGGRQQDLLVGVRFSLPLPVRNVTAATVAQKQAERRRLVLEREALALASRNEFSATAERLSARHAFARALASELLPAARAHLAATEAAFNRGEAEITQVFRARERLNEVERADLDARRSFHLALISHLAAAGRLLP